mmetsp:Transcript_26943/g.4954  ORF Transcript_26943/g.4954 Transcript_26943/m.4954 type:complete len:80 (-) Transcript_26943:36-275(-)
MKIDRRSQIRDLVQKLSTDFSIPVENLKILKKAYLGVNSYPETISTRMFLDQSLTQGRISDGALLMIESMQNPGVKGKW